MKEINDIASKHLGKAGDGSVVSPYVTPDSVDNTLLVPIPRHLNRTQYNLTGDEFHGFDTWHAYEVSFMTDNGYPVNCVAKIVYSCSSEFIVESKSLKLYMNSFNMDSMGSTVKGALDNARNRIEQDLSAALGTPVDVYLHNVDVRTSFVDPVVSWDYTLLEDNIDELDSVVFDSYEENPDILIADTERSEWDPEHLRVWTPALRSNCRVTNQPDWGDVFIHMKGDTFPTSESLLKFIVSMRSENHFHEEIAECIYKRLLDKFAPDELFVTCLYTRRGGIDINPVRYNKTHLGHMASGLRNTTEMTEKTMRQ